MIQNIKIKSLISLTYCETINYMNQIYNYAKLIY